MDFELNEDQKQILKAVGDLLAQHAGPARAIALQPDARYDHELHQALDDSGFTEIAGMEGMGLLEAALVTEAVAKAGGVVAFGAQAVVVPHVIGDRALPGPVALAAGTWEHPVRFAPPAKSVLILDGTEAWCAELAEGDVDPIVSNFGYSMGRIRSSVRSKARSLGPGSGERLQAAWRLALAIEAVGTMDAALQQTVSYVKERRQFGRTIGSFQAVQHRLAQCAVLVEASRWLAREAAYLGARPEMAATAAAYCLDSAGHIFTETHQLSGAIGFTREHDLHVWSMRLMALRVELGGVAAHRRAIAQARWGVGA